MATIFTNKMCPAINKRKYIFCYTVVERGDGPVRSSIKIMVVQRQRENETHVKCW